MSEIELDGYGTLELGETEAAINGTRVPYVDSEDYSDDWRSMVFVATGRFTEDGKEIWERKQQ